jgi:hypothetical protein
MVLRKAPELVETGRAAGAGGGVGAAEVTGAASCVVAAAGASAALVVLAGASAALMALAGASIAGAAGAGAAGSLIVTGAPPVVTLGGGVSALPRPHLKKPAMV